MGTSCALSSKYEIADYLVSSGSPPTRDKLRCDDKARARRDWRNERLRDIATALTDRSPESSLALPAEGLLHLKKGWLWLKNAQGDWRKRWIVLCGPSLNVYEDQDEQGTPEMMVELSTVTNYAEVPTSTKCGFEIRWAGPTLTLSALTQNIRSNWLQALKKAAPMPPPTPPPAESPTTPPTPRSILLSSDEEYRTASEGGRRGSEDWSELPPSPPLTRLTLNRMKNRSKIGPRLPRSQSRQSTLDSTSTDELDCGKSDNIELHNTINKHSEEVEELQKQLSKALGEIESLQEEIARLKKLQSDAAIREKKSTDLLVNLERNEKELNQRNSQAELKFLKEQRAFQRRLAEAEEMSRTFEEKCANLSRELQTKQRLITNLQDEIGTNSERLTRSRQENDCLYKRIQDLEGRYYYKSNIHMDSLTDLTNIDLDLDIDELGQNELKEYCLDLKCRFEKAILEIRAVKRELRDSHEKCDQLELSNYSLNSSMEILKKENKSEINLLIARLDHLTSKLTSAEKQLKLKSKNDPKDKRRSLSLKGRESFSINKEVEDKVTELEAKILALERGKNRRKYKRDRSNERSSPIDDKSLRRLRRKSLDSATSSEPMKLLMRLSSLESKVTNVNASNESLNILSNSATDLTKLKEESDEQDLNKIISAAQIKVSDCMSSISILKNSRSKWSTEKLLVLEKTLNEINEILSGQNNSAEIDVINSSAGKVVNQLQTLLIEKLTNLAERKRLLQESNQLDATARLELLAEKIAYENILVSRIQEALNAPATSEAVCDRLINKETKETAHLIIALQQKLNGNPKQEHPLPPTKTSAEYLSKILAKCLMSAAQGFKFCKNFTYKKTPSLNLLSEEQKRLSTLFNNYKSIKLPQLAESLALEAINLSTDKTCRIRSISEETLNDFSRTAREIVNTELIQSEINHVLVRTGQIYQNNIDQDHTYFFSFFASERAALELWSDSVGECLFTEINRNVNELSELYQNSLNKLQRQNWRRRVESERNSRMSTSLLHEFADIVAHKALIDARINVLSGKKPNSYNSSSNSSNNNNNSTNCDSLSSWLENEQYWTYIESQSLVQINQSLEAEFVCMLDRFSGECFAILGQPELEEVLGYLDDMFVKMEELQKCANLPTIQRDDDDLNSWNDVCTKCKCLRDNLENVRVSLTKSTSFKRFDHLNEARPVYLGTEYLTQVENLRASYRCALASCKERHQEADIEHLQRLCERVLGSMEQWHRRTIQELREAHAKEMEVLKQDKEQALAEETQATLAALDAMRKAHEAEVQREVARFKQEFARQQRDEIMDLSERLSVKCLEAAALEEQLGSATRQLAHAQQHILQLERNPQLSSMQN